ncbi:chromatin assembly factor-I (CAF-I) p90 subunit [Coniothyrium glycines]
MEDPAPMPPLPQKRPLDEDIEPPFSTPVKQTCSEASTPLSVLSVQTPSPTMSTALSSAAVLSNTNAVLASHLAPASSSTQPAKRRKLTQQEKDDQRLDKEAKAKARADKKAQKEAEETLKAEQKARKDDEKREKKRQREVEQQQKEDEKLKKERSQMRLNAFFAKPKDTAGSGGQAVVELSQTASKLPVSISGTSAASTNSMPASPQKLIVKNAQSDYERYFLPFNLPAHSILAPKHTFLDEPDKLAAAQKRLDDLIAHHVSVVELTRESLKDAFPARQRLRLNTPTMADVVKCHNGSDQNPVDLTIEANVGSQQSSDMLKEIPMKYLHFAEDVRPPFYGTYTRSYTVVEARHLARNPSRRIRVDTNYDYDSEAEWEEPEDGEDLNSDGEEDVDEDAEDDMDGFLDDEEDPQLKRRLISGDLVPISTGLCWQGSDNMSRLNDGSGAICTDFNDFAMGFLLEPYPRSIDPFSTAYWTPEPIANPPTIASVVVNGAGNGPMQPPRAPLAQRNMNGLLNTMNTPKTATSGVMSKQTKAKRMIPAEQLPAFRAEIDGKDLTKIGMIEALKKVFPKLPKDAITNTLSVVAARVGPTEKEKRWVLINP